MSLLAYVVGISGMTSDFTKKDGIEISEIAQNTSVNTFELSELLLFESAIDINTLLFVISINELGEGAIDKICDDIVFKNVDFIMDKLSRHTHTKEWAHELLSLYTNFNEDVPAGNSALRSMLNERNEYLRLDKSQISKHLYTEKIDLIKEMLAGVSGAHLGVLFNAQHLNRKKNKYRVMLKALRRAIVDKDNVNEAIIRERHEFIREFTERKQLIKPQNYQELLMSINLGGSMFAQNVFLQMCSQIITTKKEEAIDKTVDMLLKPIQHLELFLRTKSNTEKKQEILSFLHACLIKNLSTYTAEIDEAFKARSDIIELFLVNKDPLTTEKLVSGFDAYQETTIKGMIESIETFDEDLLKDFIVLNMDIVLAYKEFLKNGNHKMLADLKNLFPK